jgi:hypothetical protein
VVGQFHALAALPPGNSLQGSKRGNNVLGSNHQASISPVQFVIHLKTTIFCDITPCSLLKVNRRFGGICRLQLQGRRISRARSQSESRLTFKGLHGVISQKRVLFITTALRTSNPTCQSTVFTVTASQILSLSTRPKPAASKRGRPEGTASVNTSSAFGKNLAECRSQPSRELCSLWRTRKQIQVRNPTLQRTQKEESQQSVTRRGRCWCRVHLLRREVYGKTNQVGSASCAPRVFTGVTNMGGGIEFRFVICVRCSGEAMRCQWLWTIDYFNQSPDVRYQILFNIFLKRNQSHGIYCIIPIYSFGSHFWFRIMALIN